MDSEQLQKILTNRFIMVPVMLGIAAGAVVSIAGGFYTAYQVVTWIGN